MQIVENIALVSINATLFVQLGSFLLFMVILNRIMIRPLRKTMHERRQYLDKIAQEVVSADRKYREIAKQIRSEEAAARKAASKIQMELVHVGQSKAEAVVESTRQQITALRNEAQLEVDRQIAAAREQIQDQAGDLAEQMMASLLGRRSAP
jgi:F-type H+-transporting ATPase subunit b